MILRFLAGLGLGGAIPNFIALASEFAPARARSRLIVVTLWGFPAGAVLGGLMSGPMIDGFGWRAVFVFGGMLPVILAPILWSSLPESIRYLTLSERPALEYRGILRSIDSARGFAGRAEYVLPEDSPRSSRLIDVFEGRLAAGTLLLGGALCMSLLLAYLLVYWIPMLFRRLGMSMRNARLGTVVLNAGGIVGSYVISRIMDRSRLKLAVLIGFYVAAALAVAAMGIPGLSRWQIMGAHGRGGFFSDWESDVVERIHRRLLSFGGARDGSRGHPGHGTLRLAGGTVVGGTAGSGGRFRSAGSFGSARFPR